MAKLRVDPWIVVVRLKPDATSVGSRRSLLRGVRLAALLQQLGDEAGPAGLMAGADAAPVSPWKYSWNRMQVAPVRVVAGTASTSPNTGRRPSRVPQEDAREPPRELRGDLREREASGPSPSGTPP